MGLISLDLFFYNQLLPAIIFPSVDGSTDLLRTPGIFSNGGVNGYFNSLLVLYLLTHKKLKDFNFNNLLLLFIAVLIIYFTLTRKVWLALIIVGTVYLLLEALLNSKKIHRVNNLLLLLGVLFISILLAFYLFSKLDSSQALSTSSLLERFEEWTYYINFINNSEMYNILFGHGVLQSFFEKTDSFFVPILIDNAFLAVFIYAGILGLTAYSFFWLIIGITLFRNYSNNKFHKFGALVWLQFTIVSLFATFFADTSTVMFAMSVFAIAFTIEVNPQKSLTITNNNLMGPHDE
jgi:hypothetical protein